MPKAMDGTTSCGCACNDHRVGGFNGPAAVRRLVAAGRRALGPGTRTAPGDSGRQPGDLSGNGAALLNRVLSSRCLDELSWRIQHEIVWVWPPAPYSCVAT